MENQFDLLCTISRCGCPMVIPCYWKK